MKGILAGRADESAFNRWCSHTFRTVRRLPKNHRHEIACLDYCAGVQWGTKESSTEVQPQLVTAPHVDHEDEKMPNTPAKPPPYREQVKRAAATSTAEEASKKPKHSNDKSQTDSMPPDFAPGLAGNAGPFGTGRISPSNPYT